MFDCSRSGSSELFERITRRSANCVGTQFSGSIRYVIESHKVKPITYLEDVSEEETKTESNAEDRWKA